MSRCLGVVTLCKTLEDLKIERREKVVKKEGRKERIRNEEEEEMRSGKKDFEIWRKVEDSRQSKGEKEDQKKW